MSLSKKLGSKTDVRKDSEFTLIVRLLDEAEQVQVKYKKETYGQKIFDQVCEILNLLEKDYFGLRFRNKNNQRLWLDPLKSAHKQLKGLKPPVLSFRVKFYPHDPSLLREELTRYLLFLQLRRDFYYGRLFCSSFDAPILAAYIIQADIGDYNAAEHGDDYVADLDILPATTLEVEHKVMEHHCDFAGQTPSESEHNFLMKASRLVSYGLDIYEVTSVNGVNIYMGLSYQGLVTFLQNQIIDHLRWRQIKKLLTDGSTLILHATVKEEKMTLKYKCPSVEECHNIWKCALEQRFFFTLRVVDKTPKLRSSKSFFKRRSKYRFSGRCFEAACAASDSITRSDPPFTRSASLLNLSQPMKPKQDLNISAPTATIYNERYVDDVAVVVSENTRSADEVDRSQSVVNESDCDHKEIDIKTYETKIVHEQCGSDITKVMSLPESPTINLPGPIFPTTETIIPKYNFPHISQVKNGTLTKFEKNYYIDDKSEPSTAVVTRSRDNQTVEDDVGAKNNMLMDLFCFFLVLLLMCSVMTGFMIYTGISNTYTDVVRIFCHQIYIITCRFMRNILQFFGSFVK